MIKKIKKYLSNYITKFDLRNARVVHTSEFTRKANLAGLKSDMDKLDIAKLESNPADLSKLSNVVEKKVVEKTVYNESVKKFNTILANDTNNLVTKTDYNTKIKDIEDKTPDHDK